jgi:hypothetical protein
MREFRVYSGATLVGTSNLEHGNAPMGVAFGRFFPAAAYASIQAVRWCGNTRRRRRIEVNVLGISYPSYAELFPQHVAQYKASLK